jgi:putative transcriptional regulator
MIVNRLPDLMAQKGISIRGLSSMTGVTYTTIRAIYHGERRSVQLAVIEAICRALEIQPGDIYAYVPDDSNYQAPTKSGERKIGRPAEEEQTKSPSAEDGLLNGWKNW